MRGHTARELDELPQRCSDLDLDDARSPDRAAQRHEYRARLVVGAGPAEPVGAVARDQADVGECLDVLDESRATADAALERARWRESRLGIATVQPVHERALLAGDEALGDSRDADRLRDIRALGQGRFE